MKQVRTTKCGISRSVKRFLRKAYATRIGFSVQEQTNEAENGGTHTDIEHVVPVHSAVCILLFTGPLSSHFGLHTA